MGCALTRPPVSRYFGDLRSITTAVMGGFGDASVKDRASQTLRVLSMLFQVKRVHANLGYICDPELL